MSTEPVDPRISAKMRGQPSKDTRPELALRKALFALGIRYRKDFKLPLGGRARTADLAFPGQKVAVFVDGCFWHVCPTHGHVPRTRVDWWEAKLSRTVARDAETTALLTEAGWRVVRVWEHETITDATARVLQALGRLDDYAGLSEEEGTVDGQGG